MGTSSPQSGPLAIGEAEVVGLLPIADAIDVLEGSYQRLARGEAALMPRAHLRIPGGLLHSVGGYLDEGQRTYVGVKSWAIVNGSAQPTVALLGGGDGKLLALIEAAKLGQIRTAATTGLATKLLARQGAATLACLGTGKQALPQIEAVCAVRPIVRVRVWGRDRGRAEEFAAAIESTLQVTSSFHPSQEEAVDGAEVVVTVTRSQTPLLDAAEIAEGVHVNAVGAITAAASELTPAAVGRFDRIVVDSLEQARSDCGEVIGAVAAGTTEWESVEELPAVVAGTRVGRERDDERTLLRATGIGLSDVAVAAEVLRRAEAAGAGRQIRFENDESEQHPDRVVLSAKGVS